MNGDVAELAGVFVIARDVALIIAGVDDQRIARIGRNVAGFAAADGIPILTIDGAIHIAAGNGDGAVVLLRAIDVVREAIICDDVIKLRGGLVVFVGPMSAAIERDGCASIVALNHATGVCGVDPEAVVIAMRDFDFIESVAAVGGLVHFDVEDPDGVGIFGVGDDVHVIPGALGETIVGIDQLPFAAAIIGAIEAAFLGFDESVHAIGVGGHGDANFSVRTFREAFGFGFFAGGTAAEFLPSVAAIGGAIETAARAAAG